MLPATTDTFRTYERGLELGRTSWHSQWVNASPGLIGPECVWASWLVETSNTVQKDDAMADAATTIELSRSELREVAGYAVACARSALAIFERERPDDRRPQAAIDAAQAFADGGERTKALRDSAWAAHRAAQEARDAGQAAVSDAARGPHPDRQPHRRPRAPLHHQRRRRGQLPPGGHPRVR
jgi:hypothetical protein